MSVNQRRARVSPEVNTAMNDDETKEGLGLSISIPKYLKRQKSPRIHPEQTFELKSSVER
jgi:hypothetical protein